MVFDCFERLKRDAAQGDDYSRINQKNLLPEQTRTVFHLCARRLAVRAGRALRIAKRRIGDENIFAPEINRIDKFLKIRARFAIGERLSVLGGADPARRFGDEHYLRREIAVERAQKRDAARQRVAFAAVLRFATEFSEKFHSAISLIHQLKNPLDWFCLGRSCIVKHKKFIY